MADVSSRQGTSYAAPSVLAWLNDLHAPHDGALARAFAAPETQGLPAIQVGPSEGRTIMLLLKLARAERVVEIGALAGYSAIWIARALPPGGRLDTIESDPRHADVVRENIDEAGLGDRVRVHTGLALEILPRLEADGPFDAVFIDADKGNYDQYGRWAAQHVRPGGLLLGDNAFFFGNLLEDSPAASAMRRFHEEARESFETVCIPTPDGLLLGIRRGA
jgi:caffeoyl-CoA O-methyltransferase